MKESQINISVQLDSNKIPQQIFWTATESTAAVPQKTKAMLVAFWDGMEKSALRIDLWTKEMMVDEMADFYFQVLSTMADTFHRATGNESLSSDIRSFAKEFHKKFVEQERQKT
ncbi:MAG TPA: gliding motility protein GldC [Chitinophagaceae bacterium]|nr:gliding motility protein GldC [Chitinophagaceae bacterium]